MGAAGLLAVVGTAAATTVVSLRMALPRHGDLRASQGLDEMVVIKPAYESCAKPKDDCLPSRCCAASGYTCFKNSRGKGQCMKECTPGGSNGTCEGVAPHVRKVVEYQGGSLFCFSADTARECLEHLLLRRVGRVLGCCGSTGRWRHDDQSGGREKRFSFCEAQGTEDLDQHWHVRADLDSNSQRRPSR